MNARSFLTQAMAVLEWGRVLEILAGQARSSMGAECCRALALEASLEAAQALKYASMVDQMGAMAGLFQHPARAAEARPPRHAADHHGAGQPLAYLPARH